MFLKKLFGKKETVPTGPVYRIADIDASDLSAFADGIDQLQDERLDGFIIRNVLNKEEVRKLIEAHDKIGDDKKYFSDTGMAMFPPPFSTVDRTAADSRQKMEQFFIDAVEFWENFPSQFGVDFERKMHELISKIGGGRQLETPRGMDNVGKYNAAGFKHLVPGEGYFKAHCGNMFHNEFPTFYTHMNEISIIENQMSYFVMIDPPKKGGELTLYDVLWKNAEKRLNGDTILEDKNGKLLDLENQKQVRRQYLAPGAGDMIIFSGGRIWHKVELAEITRRLTLGGFVTRSQDDKKLYTWA
jgi:hypothetical protein